VATRLTDSATYAHLWSTPDLADVFEERRRLQSWLEILGALAAAQAEFGLIPAAAAEQITEHARVERLDLDFVAAETRRTAHSTLGLSRVCSGSFPRRRGSTFTTARLCRTSPTPGSGW
jgi:adenylosuccinate lyase